MNKRTKYTSLIRIVGESSPINFLLSIMAGVLAGVLYALIIPFILYALMPGGELQPTLEYKDYSLFNSPTSKLAIVFFANCFLILCARSFSMIMVTYIAKGAAIKLKLDLYRKISKLPISSLEKIGASKIITILTGDIFSVAAASVAIPTLWVSIITVVGLLGYLIFLNADVFIFVFISLIIGIVTYQIPIAIGSNYFVKVRKMADEIQEGIRGLLFGAKELKLSRKKAEEYMQDALFNHEVSALKYWRLGDAFMLGAATYGDLIAFFVIGIVAFHLPYVYTLGSAELYGSVMALLYLTGPVSAILYALPNLKQGRIALSHIASLENESEEEPGSEEICLNEWNAIRLEGVSYQYEGDCRNVFQLKPTYVEFRKGKINFIVGANGSGKSTLSKLLSQHYIPQEGAMYYGNQLINDLNRDAVRGYISAIYSDFYVFKKLYGFDGLYDDGRALKYLKYFELDKSTNLIDGGFDNINLSDGQRRRLVLIFALLEDKDVYIFDEWAADQDPKFKRIFYNEVLRDLKKENKFIIVITHDDRYFSCADRILYMEDGEIIEDIDNRENNELEENV